MAVITTLATIKLLGGASALSYGLARLTADWRWLNYRGFRLIAVPAHALPKMPRGYRIVKLDAEALANHVIDIPHNEQTARFEHGLECLAAFNSVNELVGVIWMGHDGYSEGNAQFTYRPPANGAWDTGLWVHPDHRMSRAFAALWAGARGWLETHGLDWSYSVVTDYNVASLRSHSRLGMVILGRMLILRIGNWRVLGGKGGGWQFARYSHDVDWDVPKVSDPVQLRK